MSNFVQMFSFLHTVCTAILSLNWKNNKRTKFKQWENLIIQVQPDLQGSLLSWLDSPCLNDSIVKNFLIFSICNVSVKVVLKCQVVLYISTRNSNIICVEDVVQFLGSNIECVGLFQIKKTGGLRTYFFNPPWNI